MVLPFQKVKKENRKAVLVTLDELLSVSWLGGLLQETRNKISKQMV